jgi:uncharacterized protein (DUF305 family)
VVAALAVTAAVACSADHGATTGGTHEDMAMGTIAGGTDVDAGFARDMGVHHAQAVEMAELVNGRTTDPEVGVMARDIALTQQYQIGEMRGWLDAWGLPPTSTDEPMAWMGMSGPMPGLASDEELAALRDATGAEVDRLFVELMIRHHQGGVSMAEAARDHAEAPYVRQLASSIVDSQTAEVGTLEQIRERLGSS